MELVIESNRREAQLSYWETLNRREDILRLKSKCLWLKERDSNSKYFHSVMNFKFKHYGD